MPLIRKILIANRGEIACRIIRSCREMGITTVAVFSDADKDAPFTLQADEAVQLGPAPSSESYLCGDKIIKIAIACEAQAIHPGYGFLSENSQFAQACADAGIEFIGPQPETIASLGDKAEAKEMVTKLGVPTIPSFDSNQPSEFQFPLLLKASAGGGGKGMAIVRNASELSEAMASAKRVALSAFGNDRILIERYIESPRHIEIQILGDKLDHLVHLFERECSIQRRYQKIVEESPAPGISAQLREQLSNAATAIGTSLNYESAGTVEFIVDADDNFFFLEVNTRLQVEHTVTECVTGIDIVREQIRIAQGEALGYKQESLRQTGAAMQCRIYAEDCQDNFMPRSGTLQEWGYQPNNGLRVDSGVCSGTKVSIHYDPMLAKFISHAPTRSEAIGKMRAGLSSLRAFGIPTNRRFLLDLLSHPEFESGHYNTSFLDCYAPLLSRNPPDKFRVASLVAACYWQYIARSQKRSAGPNIVRGFRNNRWRELRAGYGEGEIETWVGYIPSEDGSLQIRTSVPPVGLEATAECQASYVRVEEVMGHRGGLALRIGQHLRHFQIVEEDQQIFVQVEGYQFQWNVLPLLPKSQAQQTTGGTHAPMPAKVVRVEVQEGQEVLSGNTLVVLEAMKMEHRIVAPLDGTVSSLSVVEGEQVASGDLLVVVTPHPDES